MQLSNQQIARTARFRHTWAMHTVPVWHLRVMSGPVKVISLTCILLFLVGCSLDERALEGFTLQEMLPQSERSNRRQPDTMLSTAAPHNRLLIQGVDGNIYTTDPTGANRQAVTDDASRGCSYQQPTWSPSGEQIAFSRVDTDGDEVTSAIVVSRYDGAIISELEVPFAPFYIYWNPQGDRLVYLSNWIASQTGAMALRMVDLTGDTATVTTVAEGQPFYLAWSPDGEQLLTHVGNAQTAIRSLDGAEQQLSTASTGFPAPQWGSDGESLIFAVQRENTQQLIITDISGEPVQDITTFSGNIAFAQSPTTSQLAYVVTERSDGFPTFGALYAVDAESLRTVEVSSDPVIAFFWSPDGARLAYISFETVGESFWLRWNMWDGESTVAYERFLPSRTFLQRYLVFFDQYARSMTVWSPDSSAFVYSGIDPSGRNGIWVQKVDDQSPRRVASGVFAAWSPR